MHATSEVSDAFGPRFSMHSNAPTDMSLQVQSLEHFVTAEAQVEVTQEKQPGGPASRVKTVAMLASAETQPPSDVLPVSPPAVSAEPFPASPPTSPVIPQAVPNAVIHPSAITPAQPRTVGKRNPRRRDSCDFAMAHSSSRSFAFAEGLPHFS
jgi:hypothetical protein